MATITSTGTGDWNAGGTWVGGAVPHDTNDSVVIASGHTVTLTAHDQCNDIEINSGGTFSHGSGYQLTINGQNGTSGYAFRNNGTYTHGSGTLKIENNGSEAHYTVKLESQDANNIQFNGKGKMECNGRTILGTLSQNANYTLTLINSTCTVGGDLNIPIGTLDTGANIGLTVTGDVSVTGTLTGNESAISMGSLTIESAGTYSATNQTTTLTGEKDYWCLDVKDGGTFTHNNGMVLVTTNTNTIIRGMEGDDTSGSGANALNRLQVELGDADYRLNLDPVSGTSHTIKGNVTVAEGSFLPDDHAHTLTIEGDVSVESGGILGHADRTGNDTFGSLTIASGGTAIATSGTTTINGAATGVKLTNTGTFTHNNGTVLFSYDNADQTMNSAAITFYNLKSDGGAFRRVGTGGITVLNDFTITNSFGTGGRGVNGSNNNITVHGNTLIDGSTAGAGTVQLTLNPGGTYSGTAIFHGLITIFSGGVTARAEFDTDNATTVKIGGIRNVDGTMEVAS